MLTLDLTLVLTLALTLDLTLGVGLTQAGNRGNPPPDAGLAALRESEEREVEREIMLLSSF